MTNARPEELQVMRNFLANLYTLEQAIPGAGANLDTDSAAVWVHNRREVRDRAELYAYQRRQLCGFMGIPPGPALGAGGVSFVV
jgi:hypothetical protein